MQAHTRGKNARRRNQTNSLTTYGQDNPFAGTTPAMRFKNQGTQGAELPRPPYTADAAFTRPNTGVRWLQVVDGLHSCRTEHRQLANTRHGQQGRAKTPKGSTQEGSAGRQAQPERSTCETQERTQAGPNGKDKHCTRVQCDQGVGAMGSTDTSNANHTQRLTKHSLHTANMHTEAVV